MNDIEERLRRAFEAEASTVTEESLRPAEPPSTADPGALPSRWSTAAHSRWVWPAIAAAAVAAVTIGISVITLSNDAQRGPSHQGPATESTPSPPPPVSSAPPRAFEQGRKYDVVNVFDYKRIQATLGNPATMVLYVHRWRVYDDRTGKLIPDRQIAEHGFTPVAHTDQIETSRSTITYEIPVAPNATFILNDCTGDVGGVPTSLKAHHVTAAKFLKDGRKVATVVKLSPHGILISAQTDGGC